jgi:hypothetical protein
MEFKTQFYRIFTDLPQKMITKIGKRDCFVREKGK